MLTGNHSIMQNEYKRESTEVEYHLSPAGAHCLNGFYDNKAKGKGGTGETCDRAYHT